MARAIYASEIPVISAVGHEPDVTISDFVADRRASTPSNAAEIAVPDMSELLRGLEGSQMRLVQGACNLLQRENQRLDTWSNKRVLTDPMAFVQDKRMQLDFVQQKLGGAAARQLDGDMRRFAQLTAKSPLKVLGRGYAMAQSKQGSVLRSSEQVQLGEQIRIQLAQGSLQCTVDAKEE